MPSIMLSFNALIERSSAVMLNVIVLIVAASLKELGKGYKKMKAYYNNQLTLEC